jgi:hypothetical protein
VQAALKRHSPATGAGRPGEQTANLHGPDDAVLPQAALETAILRRKVASEPLPKSRRSGEGRACELPHRRGVPWSPLSIGGDVSREGTVSDPRDRRCGFVAPAPPQCPSPLDRIFPRDPNSAKSSKPIPLSKIGVNFRS